MVKHVKRSPQETCDSHLLCEADFISAGRALAFTGAGISKESGVPTYRDGDGLWKRYDAMEADQEPVI